MSTFTLTPLVLHTWGGGGLQGCMSQSLGTARLVLERQAKFNQVTQQIQYVMRTEELRAWPSLGRAMPCIPIHGCNAERTFRSVKMPRALTSQSDVHTFPSDDAYARSKATFAAVGARVEMQGLVRMRKWR